MPELGPPLVACSLVRWRSCCEPVEVVVELGTGPGPFERSASEVVPVLEREDPLGEVVEAVEGLVGAVGCAQAPILRVRERLCGYN